MLEYERRKFGTIRLAAEVLAKAPPQRPLRVLKLDVWNEVWDMPVYGGLAPLFQTLGPVTCVDNDLARCNSARKAGLNVVHGDVLHLPFHAQSFDVVVEPWTLEDWPEDKLQAALNEIARVLEPDGMLFRGEARHVAGDMVTLKDGQTIGYRKLVSDFAYKYIGIDDVVTE